MSEKELEILNRQTKETLIKMYLRGNFFRRRDKDIWDEFNKRKHEAPFIKGLIEAQDPRDYIWECIQKNDKNS